jgi:hypothetical protein
MLAMLNMDMVGRLRDNRVIALGGGTANEWPDLVGEVESAPAPAPRRTRRTS